MKSYIVDKKCANIVDSCDKCDDNSLKLSINGIILNVYNVFEDDTHYYFETDKFNGVKKVDNFLGKDIQSR